MLKVIILTVCFYPHSHSSANPPLIYAFRAHICNSCFYAGWISKWTISKRPEKSFSLEISIAKRIRRWIQIFCTSYHVVHVLWFAKFNKKFRNFPEEACNKHQHRHHPNTQNAKCKTTSWVVIFIFKPHEHKHRDDVFWMNPIYV